ncbi:helix-turn-helix transcriptional regulator [Achromobacter sp. NFACC18-2]|uniref:helix-turn-helix transcriptional regulator n=1 Tax=Achromobacter sp. NFACC18-2 TaxID=1564112 RepID=UPI0008C797E8|nr:AraC family transcriptional regulator [Achromobacter sp. NFACC18-2]SEJ84664.1 transcriptional regulator, AraC family [Achromobacter sp. NFACC18-2]
MEKMSRSSELSCLYCHSIGTPSTSSSGGSEQWILCIIPADRTIARASAGAGTARSCRHLSVRAPFIGIVPAWARIEMDNDDDPRGLVLALNSTRVRESAQKGLGLGTCEIPCWFTAWDPFLRETADILTALHSGISPDPVCLAAFADVISLHLARRYGRHNDANEAGTSLSQLKLSAVEHFIHEHIAENIPIERLAALVNMSASHFAHAFKNATGLTPHFYLITKRLRFAELMLFEGSLPLIDVAARAGFQTQQHFTAVFHQYAGCTPRAFRLAHNRPTIR